MEGGRGPIGAKKSGESVERGAVRGDQWGGGIEK